MSDKYGFGGGIELPPVPKKTKPTPKPAENLTKAVKAGAKLGFVDRDPKPRTRPGPKRKEPQDKISIPGPKRVVDDFRTFCQEHDYTLWQGLEHLLNKQENH